jgi:hypothetical protein
MCFIELKIHISIQVAKYFNVNNFYIEINQQNTRLYVYIMENSMKMESTKPKPQVMQ